MRIPHPDDLLVDLSDSLLAPAQRRGVPLPALLAALGFAPALGGAAVGATSVGLVSAWILAGWACVVTCLVAYAVSEAWGHARDARAWGEAQARRHRACALLMRERLVWLRGVFLAFAVGLSTACVALAFVRGGLDGVALNVGAYAVLAFGFLLLLLGHCVMPRDPDLRGKVGIERAA